MRAQGCKLFPALMTCAFLIQFNNLGIQKKATECIQAQTNSDTHVNCIPPKKLDYKVDMTVLNAPLKLAQLINQFAQLIINGVIASNSDGLTVGGSMRYMLDGMQQLMTGDSTYFDSAYLEELAECWENTDPDLIQANDGAWRGLAEFWNNDGYGTDPWGGVDTNFREENATAQDYLGMVVYEPCNYASNLPNLKIATEMCKVGNLSMSRTSSVAIIQAASFLAMGSSAYHGSHTNLGDSLDGDMIQILSYAMHQGSDSIGKYFLEVLSLIL